MRLMNRLVLTAAICLGVAGALPGAVIFDNGGPNQVYGVNMSAFQVAEDFTLGGTSDLTNIRFWTIQSAANDYLGTLAWEVYADAPGSPGSLLQSGTASPAAGVTGQSALGGAYLEYVYDIPVSFQLGAGTYWVALNNSPLNTVAPTEMLWSTTTNSTGGSSMYKDGQWVSAVYDLAFRIDGTAVTSAPVPEPGTFALLGGGLAFAALLRRRS